MKVSYVLYSLIFFILIAPIQAYTQSEITIEKSKEILNQASLALSQNHKPFLSLNDRLEKLIDESKKAKKCVIEQKKKLVNIEQAIKLNKSISSEKKTSVDLKYLKAQAAKISKLYGECQLYVIQSKDTIESLKEKILLMSQETIWLKNPALWDIKLSNIFKEITKIRSSSKEPLSFPFMYIVLLSLFLGLFLLSFFSVSFRRYLRLFKFDPCLFKRVFFGLSVYIFFVITSIIIGELFIFPEIDVTLFLFLAIPFSFLLFKFLFVNIIHLGIQQPSHLLKTVFYTAIYIIIIFSLISCVLGYNNLAAFVSISTLKTMAYISIGTFFTLLINRSYHLIVYHKKIREKIGTFLLVESYSKMHELKLIKYLLLGFVIFYCVLGIIDSWDISHLTELEIQAIYFKGVNILNIYIIPNDIVNAIMIYCILGLLIRFILHRLQEKQLPKEKVVENINPIIMNIGFILSALIALIAAGINLTGLAIIAGALSVGIGIGLKSIINNFISGIILIIEKPIKIGDRIFVDGAEGIVSKIRIRSTEIKTRDRSDILIPNEIMIVNKVTNFMLREPYWRIHCPVGVAYGSDVDKVKHLLLKVAEENDEVINNDTYHLPNVLFRGFGDNALEFELRCVVKKVNRKNFIISDINTEIERTLRENNIDIPFPQRVMHIRND